MNTEPRTALTSPRDVLIAARKRIEKPEHWTQKAWARDADGAVVQPLSDAAVCWCAEGALRATRCGFSTRRVTENLLVQIGFGGSIVLNPCSFNDELTHAEVLAAFDRAIEQCEAANA